MPYVTVNVDVDISEFSDSEILEEVERRDLKLDNDELPMFTEEDKELLAAIYINRRLNLNFDSQLDQLIYNLLGRIL